MLVPESRLLESHLQAKLRMEKTSGRQEIHPGTSQHVTFAGRESERTGKFYGSISHAWLIGDIS